MTKILVIEDEKNVLNNLKYILSSENYEVILAKDGLEGVELAKNNIPDLIICDIMMPNYNGFQVLSELRSKTETALIPFIFLTAKGENMDLRKGMGLGADDYIIKPFKIDHLLESIKTRLEKRKEFSKQIEEFRLKVTNVLPHELRTPLTAIRGYAEILAESGNLHMDLAVVSKMAKQILASEKRLERLVENYNFYVSFASPKQPDKNLLDIWLGDKETFTERIIEDIVRQKAEKYKRGGDIKLNIAKTSFSLPVNSFMKIIDELLDNAFKFTKPGNPIKIGGLVKENHFYFTIEDSGCGMTKEQIAKIGAFNQFDRKKYEQQGSGLGLYVVQRLLELSDGEMTIDSEVNFGTKITVVFKNMNNVKVDYSF